MEDRGLFFNSCLCGAVGRGSQVDALRYQFSAATSVSEVRAASLVKIAGTGDFLMCLSQLLQKAVSGTRSLWQFSSMKVPYSLFEAAALVSWVRGGNDKSALPDFRGWCLNRSTIWNELFCLSRVRI